jgi:L-asparaginase
MRNCTKHQLLYFYPAALQMQALRNIVILGTGGTIAGVAHPDSADAAYTAGVLPIDSLVAAVPGLRQAARVQAEQVANVDSKDMGDALWLRLAARVRDWLARDDIDGCVVTHGTDTLEETAYFLHLVHASHKPCVLTAAMRPASSPEADGPQNLLDAVHVAASPHACGRGVLCIMHGRIHAAARIRKLHTSRIDAFDSVGSAPVGRVAAGIVRLDDEPPRSHDWGTHALPAALPAVPIVLSHAGVDATAVEAHLRQGVRGLVVAGTGNGTMHAALEAALLRAQTAGVRVVRASRVPYGDVPRIEGRPFEPSGTLSPYQARIRLMLELAAAQPAGMPGGA